MRPTLAISLFVSGQRALVIGDGPSAADRTTRLTEAGATITAIPESAFTPAALAEHRLVFVCDEAQDPDLAARVAMSRVLSAVAMGPQQRVVTVEVGPPQQRTVLVLGVTAQNINCLHVLHAVATDGARFAAEMAAARAQPLVDGGADA